MFVTAVYMHVDMDGIKRIILIDAIQLLKIIPFIIFPIPTDQDNEIGMHFLLNTILIHMDMYWCSNAASNY